MKGFWNLCCGAHHLPVSESQLIEVVTNSEYQKFTQMKEETSTSSKPTVVPQAPKPEIPFNRTRSGSNMNMNMRGVVTRRSPAISFQSTNRRSHHLANKLTENIVMERIEPRHDPTKELMNKLLVSNIPQPNKRKTSELRAPKLSKEKYVNMSLTTFINRAKVLQSETSPENKLKGII